MTDNWNLIEKISEVQVWDTLFSESHRRYIDVNGISDKLLGKPWTWITWECRELYPEWRRKFFNISLQEYELAQWNYRKSKRFVPSPSPAVNGVDELIWKYSEIGKMAYYEDVLKDLKSLKQTPVAKDYQPKVVEIKKPVYCNSWNMSNRQNCICWYKLVLQWDMYCGWCWAKIKWIA